MRYRIALAPLLALVAVQLIAAPAHADQPSLSVNDVTVREPSSYWNSVYAHFAVKLDKASDETVTVRVTADPGTSGHFSPVATTLTFSPGETSVNVSIKIQDNRRYEPAQTYPVTLSQVTGAAVADDTGLLTVLNINPKDAIVGCRATVARWQAGTRSGTYGNANPADSPCVRDLQAGPAQGVGQAPLGLVFFGASAKSWTASTAHYGVIAEANMAASQLTAYLDPLVIEVGSVDARARTACLSDHTPVAGGGSSVEYLHVAIQDPKYGDQYGVEHETTDNLRYRLPDGTLIEINREVSTTSLTANGTLVHHFAYQAVVVTTPDGDEAVLGEARVSFTDDHCSI